MYSIERQLWGFKLTFADTISNDEMQKWVIASQHALSRVSGNFGILVDMRSSKRLASQVEDTMIEGEQLYRRAGMVRSVVILNSMALTLQCRRLAQDSGIYERERYIDASSTTNWEQVGIDWLTKGIDPDLGIGPSK